MIFLKKSCLRPARFKKCAGGITVWLALCFLVFLGLYQVCLKSVWKQCQRQRAELAAEAGMFSLLSEYEPFLLERYDLFYLDTSFRSGTEKQDELCSHLWRFVDVNLKNMFENPVFGLELKGVNLEDLERATDGNGDVFYQQAVRVIKQKTGVSLAEDWLQLENYRATAKENAVRFQQDCKTYEGEVRDYENELEEEVLVWDGLRNSFTLSMTLPKSWDISRKMIRLEQVPSHRELSRGSGGISQASDNLLDKQWFIRYLCEYLTQAQDTVVETEEELYLDYQLEYVLGGKSSDRENLEYVIRELLLMREGVNYAFLLSHPVYEGKAVALAGMIAGLTGNDVLIKSIKHLILLGWACGESIVEVRQLLGGYELSLVKSEEDWQVPLSGLLSLVGNPGRYDKQNHLQEGISYEDSLRMLLVLQPKDELAMRALDIIEGELQQEDSCEKIHLDHCVERMTAQIWLDGIYLERNAGYE